MQLLPHIYAVDLAIEIHQRETKTLVLGDIHIGYEEALNKTGHLVPRFQFQDTIKRLTNILKDNIYDQIVLNGDVKHEFGTISNQEWRDSLHILALLEKHAKKVVFIKGNHDTILGPIGEKKHLEIVDEITLGNVYICHGHIIPKTEAYKRAKIVIIGHEHPAISLHHGPRVETFKCYLVGRYKDKAVKVSMKERSKKAVTLFKHVRDKALIVMPSFNLVTKGTDILKEQLLSPFLTSLKNLDDFSVYVVEDEVYAFGKVKEMRK